MTPKYRITLIISTLLLMMLACSIPGVQVDTGSGGGNSGNGSSGDFLSTAIAQTVAAANLQATIDAQQGQTGGDTGGGDQPPPPTDTQAPPPTNTPQPTNTVEPSPTNTSLPTATSPAGDPAVSLGSPDWTHSFNKEYPWYTYDSSTDQVEIADGKLYFRFFQTISWPIWSFAAEEIEDYYVEITVKMPAACSGKDSGGLIFGSPAGHNNEGYVFRVSCDGQYRLVSFDGTNTDVLISWHTSSAILSGPNQTNRVGVMVNGNHITLYINGVKVDETNDSAYTGKGRFGVAAAAPNTADLVVIFDEAKYWELP